MHASHRVTTTCRDTRSNQCFMLLANALFCLVVQAVEHDVSRPCFRAELLDAQRRISEDRLDEARLPPTIPESLTKSGRCLSMKAAPSLEKWVRWRLGWRLASAAASCA